MIDKENAILLIIQHSSPCHQSLTTNAPAPSSTIGHRTWLHSAPRDGVFCCCWG